MMKRILIPILLLLAFLPAAAQLNNAKKIWSRDIAATAPANGDVYAWNSSTRKWTPGAGGSGSVTSAIIAGTALQIIASGTCTITTTGTCTLSLSPTVALGTANTTKGTLSLYGNTSGLVTVQPAAAAGTWSLTLPTSGGTSGYVLRTDGSGITTWVTPPACTNCVQTTAGATFGAFAYDFSSATSVSLPAPWVRTDVANAYTAAMTQTFTGATGTTSTGAALRILGGTTADIRAGILAVNDTNALCWANGTAQMCLTNPASALLTITFPNASITVARNDAAQTFTGVQTFSSAPVMSLASATSLPIGAIANALITANKMAATTFDAQTDAATITWAIASVLNAQATVTLGGNRTLNITNPVIGGNYVFRITQDGTGTRTLTKGTGCTWKELGSSAATFGLSTTAAAIDVLTFTYDGTNCLATVGKAFGG